jgi:hypothetical protein
MNPAISDDRTIICACLVAASKKLTIDHKLKLMLLFLIGILCEYAPFVSRSLPFLLIKLFIIRFEMPFAS